MKVNFYKVGFEWPSRLIGKIEANTSVSSKVIAYMLKPFIVAIYLPPYILTIKQK